MMRIMGLINKAKNTIKNEGIGEFFVKTKRFLEYHARAKTEAQEMKDILFINGCGLPHPARYRVAHQIEQLESNGLRADEVFYEDLKMDSLKYYRGFVFFRCPITPVVSSFIDKAKYFNKKVFFDVDDLVIDKKYTDTIDYVKNMAPNDRKIYDDGVVRMGETMKRCDYLITTTNALARELKKYKKEVFINRNVASEEMIKLSLRAINVVHKSSEDIVIGYLSGSITHNPDFELIKPALIKIMDEFSNVKLLLMGYLDLPEDLMRFSDRIIRKPFGDWRGLPKVLAGVDINLAPIEESVFNEAKSENKWMEAALCGVVTVASDFGAFHDIMVDGKNGFLCKNCEDWYEKIKKLVVNDKLRDEIGKIAQKQVLKKYVTTYAGFGLANFIESKLARNIAFVLPSTNISGGVNVVLKHCNILRENGWDSMVINMDTSDDNFMDEECEINVVSGVKHEICARFYDMVATLYTTLKYVKEYPEVKRRVYLVQGFETDLGDYGESMRGTANATYNSFVDIKYITVSKWCEKWLKERFKKSARYIPNGINLKKFNYKKRKFDGKVKVLIEGNSDDYYKNVDESFEIVKKLDPNKYEIHYLSYQGEPKKWYRVDVFHHCVPHDEVGKVYSECDILLKTSILESFSYPPLEMMATGGYVVALQNDGNVEYLKDGENCLLYAQGDIDDAVKKIKRIVDNPSLRKKLTENANKVVQTRCWENIKEKIVESYRK